jgi:cytochrome c-type biogenesis protein CcmH/NrfG
MWRALGNAYLSAGSLPQAESAYRQALALDPKHRETQYNLPSFSNSSGLSLKPRP